MYLAGTYQGVDSGVPILKIKVNNMREGCAMVNLGQLDVEISHDVAQEYYDYRQAMEKRYRLKTQGQFDRQMKIALRAHEVGMTPDELILFTIDKNWVGINISYTKAELHRQIQAGSIGVITRTKDRAIIENLTDTSWSH